MRTNKGPYSPQPMRQFGNARTDRLQKPGQFGQPMGGPKPMGMGRGAQAFGQLSGQFGGGMQGGPSGFNAAGVNSSLVNGANLFNPSAYQQNATPGANFGFQGGGSLQGMASTLEGINARRAGGEFMTPWDNGNQSPQYGNYQRGQRPGLAPITGPQGGIPGLPGYDPNANVQGVGGPQMSGQPAAPEQFGPGDMGPNQYQGLSGSEIFARLFGQRP